MAVKLWRRLRRRFLAHAKLLTPSVCISKADLLKELQPVHGTCAAGTHCILTGMHFTCMAAHKNKSQTSRILKKKTAQVEQNYSSLKLATKRAPVAQIRADETYRLCEIAGSS